MPNYVYANSICINTNCFTNNTNIVNVNLKNHSFTNNSMYNAFNGCTNLTDVRNINNNITNISGAFRWCNSLVNSPKIPNCVINMYDTFACSDLINVPDLSNCNHVINMGSTFGWCRNLSTSPVIPNSVTCMHSTFYGCWNLVNSPIIPNTITDLNNTFGECFNLITIPDMSNATSLVNMFQTFYECIKLTGNFYINSNQITNAISCFNATTLTKNVYIPFMDDNAVNSATYNSFTTAGYDNAGTSCGVYLKDLNPHYNLELNNYTYTTNGNAYELTAYTGTETNIKIAEEIEQ